MNEEMKVALQAAKDARIGFMSLSNNLPMLYDEFNKMVTDDDKLTKKTRIMKEIIPHKCPICSGSGRVLDGFYCDKQYQSTVFNYTETCRSCHGMGILYLERITEIEEKETSKNTEE